VYYTAEGHLLCETETGKGGKNAVEVEVECPWRRRQWHANAKESPRTFFECQEKKIGVRVMQSDQKMSKTVCRSIYIYMVGCIT
jgi:hypothetical protein